MPLNHEVRDIPLRQKAWRNGPVTFELDHRGVLPWGSDGLFTLHWDFETFIDSGSGLEGWHQDAVGTPTTAAGVVADGAYGVVLMAPGSTAADNIHYQYALNTTVLEPITMAAGKRLLLRVRVKTEDADQNLILAGLHEAADDPWGTYPNDSFLFRTTSGDPDGLVFSVSTSNAAIVNSTAYTIADNTWYVCEAYYDGADTVQVRIYNSDMSAVLYSENVAAAGASVIPTTPMTIAFGMENVDTGADDFSLDYITIAAER